MYLEIKMQLKATFLLKEQLNSIILFKRKLKVYDQPDRRLDNNCESWKVWRQTGNSKVLYLFT